MTVTGQLYTCRPDLIGFVNGLPGTHTKDLYNTKCEVLFEHVYESYQGDGRSVYA